MIVLLDLPEADYHARPELSTSGVNLLALSPAHYRAGWTSIGPDVARVGKAFHARILEDGRGVLDGLPDWERSSNDDREAWAAWFAEHGATIDTRRKEGLPAGQWLAELERQTGLLALSPSEADVVDGMAAGIHRNPAAVELLARSGVAEASIVTTIAGAPFRVRPDWMVAPDRGAPLVVNLKTVADASRSGFRRQAANLRWHVTDAAYTEAYRSEFGVAPRHVFIAHEKSAPYSCAIYVLDDEARENGLYLLEREIDTFLRCSAANDWPEYPGDTNLDIPIYDREPDIPLVLPGEAA